MIKAQFSGIKYIHIVVHPSSHPSPERFPPCKTEILHPLNKNSPLLLPPAPGNLYSPFCLCELACSRHLGHVESNTICPFGCGFCDLA